MDIFPDARFEPTRTASEAMEMQGLTLQDAVNAVRNFMNAWEGRRANQRWFQGPSTRGSLVNVLVEVRTATLIRVIIIHRVWRQEG